MEGSCFLIPLVRKNLNSATGRRLPLRFALRIDRHEVSVPGVWTFWNCATNPRILISGLVGRVAPRAPGVEGNARETIRLFVLAGTIQLKILLSPSLSSIRNGREGVKPGARGATRPTKNVQTPVTARSVEAGEPSIAPFILM